MAKRSRTLVAAAALSVGLTGAYMAARAPAVSAVTGFDHVYNAATVYAGQPHVFSYKSSTMNLQHGWWDGTRWRFETLDGTGCGYPGCFSSDDVGLGGIVGNGTAPIVFNGQLHVFTYDITTHGLVHDWFDGTWHFEQLDGSGSKYPGHNGPGFVGYWTSVVLYGGQLHVFPYVSSAPGSLGHDWWDGTSWHFEILDGPGSTYAGAATSDQVGYFSTALVYGTQLQVFYSDSTHYTLHQAWWDGAHWHFQCLDGRDAGCVRDTASTDGVGEFNAALLYKGLPHVFYYDLASHSLLHAWWDTLGWHSEHLDGPGSAYAAASGDNVGQFNAAVVFGTQLQVWTYDGLRFNLEHDWWDGSHWSFEKLAGADKSTTASGTDSVGDYNAAVIYNGAPHVWSHDASNQALFHGWWTGSAWAFEEFR